MNPSKKNEVEFLERFFAKRGLGDISLGSLSATIFDQKSQKRLKKDMQKSMSKKYRKRMPEVIKNDAKMDTKIDYFSNISENG